MALVIASEAAKAYACRRRKSQDIKYNNFFHGLIHASNNFTIIRWIGMGKLAWRSGLENWPGKGSTYLATLQLWR